NAGLLLHEKSKMRTNKGGLWLAVLVGVKRDFDFVGFAAQVVAFNRHVELAVGAGIFDGQQRGTGFKGLELLSLRVELTGHERKLLQEQQTLAIGVAQCCAGGFRKMFFECPRGFAEEHFQQCLTSILRRLRLRPCGRDKRQSGCKNGDWLHRLLPRNFRDDGSSLQGMPVTEVRRCSLVGCTHNSVYSSAALGCFLWWFLRAASSFQIGVYDSSYFEHGDSIFSK